MGEAFRKGDWAGLVNLTYSPGYPVLLGIAQAFLKTTPLNELPLLRITNVFCFVLAMGMCDLVVWFVRREVDRFKSAGERPLPLSIITALCYSMFLVSSLVFARIRLINPDMLIVGIVLQPGAHGTALYSALFVLGLCSHDDCPEAGTRK